MNGAAAYRNSPGARIAAPQIQTGGKTKPAMKIKSYYARTVEEALARASDEMGADAVLVHSRKTPLEARHLGLYEVVFALLEAEPKGSEPAPAAMIPAKAEAAPTELSKIFELAKLGPEPPPPPVEPAPERPVALSKELLEMRQQIEELRRAVQLRPQAAPAASSSFEAPATLAAAARARLLDAGLDPEIANRVIEAAKAGFDAEERAAGGRGRLQIHEALLVSLLRVELARHLRTAPPIAQRGKATPIVALIGPPGVGKTSAIMKCAVARSANAKRLVHLVSADTYRIGAAEQLRTFASLLGVGLDMVDSAARLGQVLEANRNRELILIDTPGLSGQDFELLDPLAEVLARRNDIEKHLVLPATMRNNDLKRMAAQYAGFHPDKLIFTHLDETDSFGALYSTAVRCDAPVSFLSAGQQVPEDLEEASPEVVSSLVLSRPDSNG